MSETATGDDDANAPGWDAIDAALAPLYPDQKPQHYGTIRRWRLGGRDPLDGISAYARDDPAPHWHFVTYGLSELYAKETDDPEYSGYGFELTFRLARDPADPADGEPPAWAMNFLQNLARYVFESGNVFDDGHWMTANGPIALARKTAICSMGFVFDPELPAIHTPNGRVAFLQVVGLTIEEEQAAKRWKTRSLLDALLPHMPLWITDLNRASLLERDDVRKAVDEGVKRDGSATGSLYTDVLGIATRKRALRAPLTDITLGSTQVRELADLLPARLLFDRPLRITGREHTLRFVRAAANAVSKDSDALTLHLTDATVRALAATLQARAGEYRVAGLDNVLWHVEKTVIRDSDGNVTETIG
jgi:hypothetical protein